MKREPVNTPKNTFSKPTIESTQRLAKFTNKHTMQSQFQKLPFHKSMEKDYLMPKSLPFLPGNSYTDPAVTRYHKTQLLGVKDGTMTGK